MLREVVSINSSQKQTTVALGIDFGTTNSLIGFSKNNIVKIIKHPNGEEMVKSIVSWDLSGNISVGANSQSRKGNYVYSIKRFLGKSTKNLLNKLEVFSNYFDYKNDHLLDLSDKNFPKFNIIGKKISPYILASYILRKLKKSAEKYLNTTISKVVISVPAYFDNKAKAELLYAAELTGLEVIRLIAEPTAAAYAYNLQTIDYGHYLVYDLGGGTFDISILHVDSGVLQVLNVKGDNLLGGDDIDQVLLEYFVNNNAIDNNENAISQVKKIKESLSYQEKITINHFKFTRKKLEELIAPIINKTIKLMQDSLLESDIKECKGIILVGGSTKIPYVKNQVKEIFPNVKIYDFLDPDKVVAIGSAIHAEHLTNKDVKDRSILIDVIPLSVGIELYGGLFEKIILRNTPLPYSTKEEFTTFVDNQTAIKINIFQGERESTKDCVFLGSFELSDLEPKSAGNVKIEITFHVDINGILYLFANEKNDLSNSVTFEINIFKNLNQQMIDKTVEDSYQNAQKDFDLTKLYHAKLNAMIKIKEVKKFLFSDNSKLGHSKVQDTLKILKEFVDNDDYKNIVLYTDLLDQAARDALN